MDHDGRAAQRSQGCAALQHKNVMDGVVLDVLVRRAREIYKATAVSVPVPVNSESVMKAVIRGSLREQRA